MVTSARSRGAGLPWGFILPALGAFAISLFLDVRTLMPDVGTWDTAEFQTVGPVLGIAHPTGFPTYTLLLWLASVVLQPFGDPAYRANLLSALLVSGAAALVAIAVVQLTRKPAIGLAAGVLLAIGTHRLARRAARRPAHPAPLPDGAAAGAAAGLGTARARACREGRALAAGSFGRLRAVARQPRPDPAAGTRRGRLRAAGVTHHPVAAMAPGAGLPAGGGHHHGRRLCLHPAARGHVAAARLCPSHHLGALQVPRAGRAVPGHLPPDAVAVAGRAHGLAGAQGQPGAGGVAGPAGRAHRRRPPLPAARADRPVVPADLPVRAGLRQRRHRALLPGAHHGRGHLGGPGGGCGLGPVRGVVAALRAEPRAGESRPW